MRGSRTSTAVGVLERVLHVERDGHTVPIAVWRPAAPASTVPGLVLLGHGGSGHERAGRILELALRLVRDAGLAVVAIDGPHHGERVPQPLAPRAYQYVIADDGAAQVVDRMTGDWLAAIEAVGDLAVTDPGALGDRLRCAVFGKIGLEQGPVLPAALDTAEILRSAARHVTARTLFHVQWHDELFPRAGQLDLFDQLGCRHKRLIAHPGRHADTDPDAIATWCDFLVRNLVAQPGTAG